MREKESKRKSADRRIEKVEERNEKVKNRVTKSKVGEKKS